jgi:hypothetical protein
MRQFCAGRRGKASAFHLSPTGDCPPCRNKNRVSRVVSGESSGIVVLSCLLIRLNDCEELLGCLWIGQVFLLGVSRQSKADCQPYEGNY